MTYHKRVIFFDKIGFYKKIFSPGAYARFSQEKFERKPPQKLKIKTPGRKTAGRF